ncbi:hypothetical protein [Methylobacterium oxalidis]|uniref:hypothetical protein n=1 Tax=Methylobacterium oxalidis TaxID=944322 RepID=UPI0033156AA0
MLFLLADFFEILIQRVLKFLKRKQSELDTEKDSDSEGNFESFTVGPSPEQIRRKLDQFAKLLPTPPGQPCACLVCNQADPKNVIVSRNNVSIDACQALDRLYGHLFQIQYIPPQSEG